MTSPLVECQGLVKVLGRADDQTVAVNEVTFELHAGDAVALMGPSGGGKSTLLGILGLMLRPTQGVLKVGGVVAPESDVARARLRNSYFGYVHQEHGVITSQSALGNACIPLEYARPKVSAAERRTRGEKVLARVGLAEKAHRRAGDLSGGERQRVAISRSLINTPTVILADEPTASLDTITGMAIIDLLMDAKAHGVGVIIATHDYEVARRCDRVVSIRDGRLERNSHPAAAGH
jgi:putative ABC transport system ATP-binding protein